MESVAIVETEKTQIEIPPEMETALLNIEQVECPITHHFGGGIYMREMFAPAGTLMIGHDHKTEHVCILLKGTLRFANANGTISELTAPATFVAGTGRKLVIALEDIVFMNVHPTKSQDLAEIEEQFIVKSEAWTNHQIEERAKLLIEGTVT